MNSHPSPREHSVRDYIKSLQRRDAARDKANYADKGRDTLLDGYTEPQLLRSVRRFGHRLANRPSATSVQLSISFSVTIC